MRKDFACAVATLIGTIVGVGIFGIPFVISRSGFLIGLVWLFLLAIVATLINLFYGEIILRTERSYRLTGYAKKYLGKWGKGLAVVSLLFGFYGALLAYIIVGGEFLFTLFSPLLGGTVLIYSLILFALGALGIWKGIKTVALVEFIMTGLLLLTAVIIFVVGAPAIKLDNLSSINFKYFALPYGVILFSFGGLVAIPDLRQILSRNKTKLKKTIILGTLIPLIVYILFSLAVVGVTGKATSQEALIGLTEVLGSQILTIGLIFGVLAILTSFLILGMAVKETYWLDFKINKHLAWILACFIPLTLFLLNVRDFIKIIGMVGAIMMGIYGIILILCYLKAKKLGQRKPEYSLKVPKLISYLIILLLILGIFYQIFYY